MIKLNINLFLYINCSIYWKNSSEFCHCHFVYSVLFCNLREFPGNIRNWPLYSNDKEQQKRGRPLQNGGWRFKKQGNVCEVCLEATRPVYLRTCLQESQVYIEALTRSSHVYCPDGLSNTLLTQGCLLENASHCRSAGQPIHSKDRGGVRSFWLRASSLWFTGGHDLTITSSNTVSIPHCWINVALELVLRPTGVV